MMKYKTLSVTKPEDLVFGKAPYPVTTPQGLTIGGGTVYPELNFTLPPVTITRDNHREIISEYEQIVDSALLRAKDLHQEAVLLEFETVPEMTSDPSFCLEITSAIADKCRQYQQNCGMKADIRLTPNDLRDMERPVRMRSSRYLEPMFELFEQAADAGAGILSIESTGGKELCDQALVQCDIESAVYSLSVLGVRDMQFLWSRIADICTRTGAVPGGDTACGFGNTAMVLADKHYIPKVFAAVVRIITAPRTLTAIEEGAIGPDKDCGYEGPFLKAITGTPISMEGRTAACAHFSPVGNVAGVCCDLWSNESVADTMLLSGMAPTVYMEQLIYDTRLFNQAAANHSEAAYIKMMSESDIHLDPQALILSPESVIEISEALVSGTNPIDASIQGALKGLEIIEGAVKSGSLLLEEREHIWIDMIRQQLAGIPADEQRFTERMEAKLKECGVQLTEYGL